MLHALSYSDPSFRHETYLITGTSHCGRKVHFLTTSRSEAFAWLARLWRGSLWLIAAAKRKLIKRVKG